MIRVLLLRAFGFLDSLSDLKRFSDLNSRASKLSTYINFPLKDLDLREFSSASGGECWTVRGTVHGHVEGSLTDGVCLPADHPLYNLYAVSNHSGNTLGGHYTAYCRHPVLREWYNFNDSR